MKLFDLMQGGEVRLAPNTKVIPKEELSVLLETQTFLDTLSQDAEAFRQKVVMECEQMREKLIEEGFNEGLNQWTQQLALLEKRAKMLKDEMDKALVPAAISAAKKIVARELKTDHTTIVDIVRQALRSVAQDRHFVIYANKADIEALEEHKQRLKEFLEHAQLISFRESDTVKPGDCTIETENGIIKVEAEKQWEALENALRSLFNEGK